MAATHAHYIRSIHTSFTAGPHSSTAWASAASTASSQYLNSLSYFPRPSSPALPQVHQNTSINTHNTHMYTHHLRDLTHSPRPNTNPNHNHHHHHQNPSHFHHHPPAQAAAPTGTPASKSRLPRAVPDVRSPSPTTLSLPYPHSQAQSQAPSDMPVRTTRRRSASIRAAPSSISASLLVSKRPKFDPFADEPIVPVLSLPADSASVRDAISASDIVVPSDVVDNQPQGNVPYTIQIPAAQLDEIREYTASVSTLESDQVQARLEPPATPRLAAASLPALVPNINMNTNTNTKTSRRLSANAPSFTPMALKTSPPPSTPTPQTSQVQAERSPSPKPTRSSSPTPTPTYPTLIHPSTPNPNLSKVVASILLNRVHAVGRPMRVRKRVNQVYGSGYVKSCLSSVVSVGVEA